MKVTNVFKKTIKAFNDKNIRYIVSYGGTSSSKSISIYQLLYLYAMKNANKRIAIIAESVPVIKRNSLYDIKNHIFGDEWSEENYNNTDRILKFNNGSTIWFISASNPDSFRGFRSDVAYFDEINNITEEAFIQVSSRCKEKIICSFNPTSEFYIKNTMVLENCAVIHSTYRDNQFLSKNIVNDIIAKGKKSKRYRDVFVEGKFGVSDGIVFEEDVNYKIINNFDDNIKNAKWRLFGIDWGFTNDPSTLIEAYFYDKKIYVKQHIYKNRLSTKDIYNYIIDNNLKNERFFSDNSEPREIDYLYKKGINIKGVKYKINSSIDRLKEFVLYIDDKSIETISELRNYSYKKNKYDNTFTNVLVDDFNHSIDALRYAVSEKIASNSNNNIRIVNI